MKVENLCPLCQVKLFPLWKEISFSYCRRCGLKVRDATMPQEIDKLYIQSWADPHKNKSETGGTNQYFAKTYIDLLSRQLGNFEFSGKHILDFGSGRGDTVEELISRGSKPVCIEPYGYDLLKEKGYQVYRDILGLPPYQKFHGIMCIDVIEHLQNPLKDLAKIAECVALGGWIFVSTPNSNSLRAKLQGYKWEEANRSGHLYLFTPKSMEEILIKAGFSKIIRLTWDIHYHDNWVRGIINSILTYLKLDGELRYLAFK